MASIIVSGDTSGSVTLAAPAVAGTTTLTLPTTTGTLVVTGGAQTIEFADGTVSAPSITNSGDTNTGIYFPAADTIAFTEGGVESMRIDSSGNVGIGTSSPASLLDITGNDPTIRLTDNAGSPASTWSMRSTDGNFAIRDVTNSFDRATFNANGCMALTGANLTATGIGITFPATQSASSNANTLDDYEEGTWTPGFTGFNPSGTVTYTANYVKIGKQVFVTVTYSTTGGFSTGTGGGSYINNLPFTPASGTAGYGATTWGDGSASNSFGTQALAYDNIYAPSITFGANRTVTVNAFYTAAN